MQGEGDEVGQDESGQEGAGVEGGGMERGAQGMHHEFTCRRENDLNIGKYLVG